MVVVDGADLVLRDRVELSDPTGRIPKNAYQRARGLELDAATELVEAAARIAHEQAVAALTNANVRVCAVVVGSDARDPPLGSILASHALAHAAEGRLYQRALLEAAESLGLEAVAVPRATIWEQRHRLDKLGPPWGEDQKLAALAAWTAIGRR
jgi:ribosomal protein S18 acetylase RimI-like enzyme